MKKTKMTLVTAAVLTVAATSHPDFVQSISQEEIQIAPVYGPPSYFAAKGDVNMDGEVNILDYCLIRNAALGEGDYDARDISDINKDGKINKFDIFSIQDYLLGKTAEITSYRDNDPATTDVTTATYTNISTQPISLYGCFTTFTEPDPAVSHSQPPVTTTKQSQPSVTTITEPRPQPEYGCYVTFTEPEPAVTTASTSQTPVTTIKQSLPPVTTVPEPRPQPEYGCFETNENDEVK